MMTLWAARCSVDKYEAEKAVDCQSLLPMYHFGMGRSLSISKASHSASVMTIPGTLNLHIGPQFVRAAWVNPFQHSRLEGWMKYT